MKYLLAAFLVLRLTAAPVPDLTVGKPLPGYHLDNVATGEAESVHAHLGKKMVLHIFASW